MQDLTEEAASAVPDKDEHAEIIALMTSEAWNRRLDEARTARDRVLAQRNRPAKVSVFRRPADRPARRDLLPPLEPVARSGGGTVIRLVPLGSVAPLRPAVADVVPDRGGSPKRGFRFALVLAGGFVAGLVVGLAVSVPF